MGRRNFSKTAEKKSLQPTHHLPARIYGIFGGKQIGSDELRTPLRTHKKLDN